MSAEASSAGGEIEGASATLSAVSLADGSLGSFAAEVGSGSGSATLPALTVPTVPVMKPSGSKFTSVCTISFAEDMNPRFRSTMEDASVVIDGYGGDAGSGYFGVYDGHGGRNVADYLRLHLHVAVEKELQVKGDRSVEECLKSAFLITDMECSATGEQASGSTAAVCIIRRQGPKRYIYTANCGDARAVLCHAGAAVRLSKDHKATDALERARIEAAGGFVIRKRVMGVLAVARSFGDYVLKKFVTTEPYTSTTKIDGMSQFVIIACDGVWDVLEDQEAVDLIKAHVGLTASSPAASYATSSVPPSSSATGSAVGGSITGSASSSSPPAGSGSGAVGGSGAAPALSGAALDAFASSSKVKTAAQVLVDAALERGSSDNITALVVFL